ncbi:hypothetical protein ACFFX0_05885 [Citricoccus parietis]|uniref:Uncharacterized protein n=1 Tax=Citricoccus parietis TaxID=592307 RepID=A0ABV5FVM7_9MICC
MPGRLPAGAAAVDPAVAMVTVRGSHPALSGRHSGASQPTPGFPSAGVR